MSKASPHHFGKKLVKFGSENEKPNLTYFSSSQGILAKSLKNKPFFLEKMASKFLKPFRYRGEDVVKMRSENESTKCTMCIRDTSPQDFPIMTLVTCYLLTRIA